MWTTHLTADHRSLSLGPATIDVLVEPRASGSEQVAVVRVAVPPGARMPPHDHGESAAVLLPASGALQLIDAAGRDECLRPGTLAVVAAHERVSVENVGEQPATMLVCFAPATFVDALDGAPAGAGSTAAT